MEAIQTLCFRPVQTFSETVFKIDPHISNPVSDGTEKLGDREVYERQRVPIEKSKLFPYTVHGVVLIHTGNPHNKDPLWGTGIMIAPNVVLTAAHNLYDETRPRRQKYPKIQFIPAINGDVSPFGIIDVDPEEIYAPERFISFQSENIACSADDYGIMILNESIGKRTGYFGLKVTQRRELEDKSIQIVGYPGDKVCGKQGVYEQWGAIGKIYFYESQGGLLHHQLSTYHGQSGSGVFVEEGPDQFYVVGVHASGTSNYNTAVWITNERFSQILEWIDESQMRKEMDSTKPVNGNLDSKGLYACQCIARVITPKPSKSRDIFCMIIKLTILMLLVFTAALRCINLRVEVENELKPENKSHWLTYQIKKNQQIRS